MQTRAAPSRRRDAARGRRLAARIAAGLVAAALFLLALPPAALAVAFALRGLPAAAAFVAFAPPSPFRVLPFAARNAALAPASGVFPTEMAAALDFGRRNNARSIAERREYAAILYRTVRVAVLADDGTRRARLAFAVGYAYTTPVVGAHDAAVPDLFGAGGVPVGLLHTHGAYSPAEGEGNDAFSFGAFRDTWWAAFFRLPFYLATPDGHMRVYRPFETGAQTATAADDLPYDPYHPGRIRYGGCRT